MRGGRKKGIGLVLPRLPVKQGWEEEEGGKLFPSSFSFSSHSKMRGEGGGNKKTTSKVNARVCWLEEEEEEEEEEEDEEEERNVRQGK